MKSVSKALDEEESEDESPPEDYANDYPDDYEIDPVEIEDTYPGRADTPTQLQPDHLSRSESPVRPVSSVSSVSSNHSIPAGVSVGKGEQIKNGETKTVKFQNEKSQDSCRRPGVKTSETLRRNVSHSNLIDQLNVKVGPERYQHWMEHPEPESRPRSKTPITGIRATFNWMDHHVGKPDNELSPSSVKRVSSALAFRQNEKFVVPERAKSARSSPRDRPRTAASAAHHHRHSDSSCAKCRQKLVRRLVEDLER